jgi:hypothetical protein
MDGGKGGVGATYAPGRFSGGVVGAVAGVWAVISWQATAKAMAWTSPPNHSKHLPLIRFILIKSARNLTREPGIDEQKDRRFCIGQPGRDIQQATGHHSFAH